MAGRGRKTRAKRTIRRLEPWREFPLPPHRIDVPVDLAREETRAAGASLGAELYKRPRIVYSERHVESPQGKGTMLFPFTERVFSLEVFRRDYLPTLLGDLAKGFSGHLLLLSERSGRIASLLDGRLVSGLRLHPSENFERLHVDDAALFEDLPEAVDVELLSAPEDAVAMTQVYCRTEPVWRGGSGRAAARAYEEAWNHDAAIVARRQGKVTEFAYLENGEFKIGYRFEAGEARYVRVGQSFFEGGLAPGGFLEVTPVGPLSAPEPELPRLVDPLAAAIEKYILVLNIVGRILYERQTELAPRVISKIIDVYKKNTRLFTVAST